MPTVISPSEKKRLVDGAFRAGGIGLWGMKRGRAWRPTLPAADGENACGDEATARSALPRQGDVLVGPGLQEATVSVHVNSWS
jgi:hypothetical protein